MKYAITKEMRYYLIDQIRRACIKNEWYTCGTNEEYEAMFDMATDPVDEGRKMIEPVAMDIWKHSDNDVELSTVYWAIGKIYKEAWDAFN